MSKYAYMAGFIDADGSIRSYSVKGKYPRKGFEIVLWNTDKRPLDWVRSQIHAGTFSQRSTVNKTLYGLHIRKMSDLIKLIPELLPYLIIKKDKAEELLHDIKVWQSR